MRSSLRGAFATKQSRTLCRRTGLLRRCAPRNDDDGQRKDSGTPKGVFRNLRALAGTARALRGTLASRRSTTALAVATERHRSARATRLPGTCSERPSRWFERRSASQRIFTRSRRTGLHCVTRGHYPRLKIPVQRDCTRRPVVMPVGRVLPEPPGGRGDEPRPAGTALAPPAGVTRPASWHVSEIRSLYLIMRRFVKALSRHRRRRCTHFVILKARSKDAPTAPPRVLRGSTRSASSTSA